VLAEAQGGAGGIEEDGWPGGTHVPRRVRRPAVRYAMVASRRDATCVRSHMRTTARPYSRCALDDTPDPARRARPAVAQSEPRPATRPCRALVFGRRAVWGGLLRSTLTAPREGSGPLSLGGRGVGGGRGLALHGRPSAGLVKCVERPWRRPIGTAPRRSPTETGCTRFAQGADGVH
jgi:hypothetical protein